MFLLHGRYASLLVVPAMTESALPLPLPAMSDPGPISMTPTLLPWFQVPAFDCALPPPPHPGGGHPSSEQRAFAQPGRASATRLTVQPCHAARCQLPADGRLCLPFGTERSACHSVLSSEAG